MTEPAPLSPPLVLEAPAPLAPVAATQAPAMAPRIDDAALPGLDAKVDQYVAGLASAQTGSPEFAAKADDVRLMGDSEIRAAADTSNRLLQMPVKELRGGGVSGTSKVSASLLDLRRTVEDLDPSEASTGKKILGFLPFGRTITDYFRKYESAQKQIDAIVRALYNGQDELRKDNAALNLEKQHLWATMTRLHQYIYVAEKLDARLSAMIAELDATDPTRAKAMREDVLFYVRQKHQDLLTQLAVSIQGYLATDIIIKNNLELIKGVDRATTTTVSALRTAVLVAQALNNQKLVLDQISALNTTTSAMVASTSKMLREQSVEIQSQAASSTLDIQALQQSFNDIYATMDAIDEFKVKALDSMSQTIGVLETETTRAREYIDRVSRSDAHGAAASPLDIG
ncbi:MULTISPECIES: toxic anion resistance protein [Cellulomonas]|uniref:Toxic anion resistance family protein n=1 Tax=Cellulomonas gilvus (strain ATCC 13127 / NRRL B-14078) TaxID=593907 RepID=F8A4D3_CELGA|nr:MULTISPECIES: toxic anion resistance protein [Cellulomonas]AEI12039.1 toxic anion resistance family protein [Cellulomonas gilvus ATCC 13127]MCR6690184.1 toxic anion resistance protein [Cellulomonas sp.]